MMDEERRRIFRPGAATDILATDIPASFFPDIENN